MRKTVLKHNSENISKMWSVSLNSESNEFQEVKNCFLDFYLPRSFDTNYTIYYKLDTFVFIKANINPISKKGIDEL